MLNITASWSSLASSVWLVNLQYVFKRGNSNWPFIYSIIFPREKNTILVPWASVHQFFQGTLLNHLWNKLLMLRSHPIESDQMNGSRTFYPKPDVVETCASWCRHQKEGWLQIEVGITMLPELPSAIPLLQASSPEKSVLACSFSKRLRSLQLLLLSCPTEPRAADPGVVTEGGKQMQHKWTCIYWMEKVVKIS